MHIDSHLMLRYGNLNCPYHINPQLEVLYVKKGNIIVNYESRQVMLSSGEASIVLPYSIHGFKAECENDATVFMFSNAIADGISAGSNIEDKFRLSEETAVFVEHVLAKEKINVIDAKALFYAFISESPHINSETPAKSEQISRVVEWIYKKTGEKITLDEAATEFGVSKRSLTAFFKNRLGISFTEFLNGVRIEKAKNLLIKGELTSTEIAYESGFGSVRSFNRMFLHFVKCTPGEYKKIMK